MDPPPFCGLWQILQAPANDPPAFFQPIVQGSFNARDRIHPRVSARGGAGLRRTGQPAATNTTASQASATR